MTERAPLQQVLLNLVANAITHGGDGVRIAITAEDRGREIEVAVADDGPGLPPLMRERIWELFHTGATGAKGGGAGIGLAVVRRLVEDRGGRAWVAESSGPGTTFRFIWPKESSR
jgi:signal transduction histidine kinase